MFLEQGPFWNVLVSRTMAVRWRQKKARKKSRRFKYGFCAPAEPYACTCVTGNVGIRKPKKKLLTFIVCASIVRKQPAGKAERHVLEEHVFRSRPADTGGLWCEATKSSDEEERFISIPPRPHHAHIPTQALLLFHTCATTWPITDIPIAGDVFIAELAKQKTSFFLTRFQEEDGKNIEWLRP